MLSLEDAKKALDEAGIYEVRNPLSKTPSLKFQEVSKEVGRSLSQVFVEFGLCHLSKERMEKFGLEKGDSQLFYDELIAKLTSKEEEMKWSEFLGRPKKEWGKSPLEKAAWNCLQNPHFLAVELFSFLSFCVLFATWVDKNR